MDLQQHDARSPARSNSPTESATLAHLQAVADREIHARMAARSRQQTPDEKTLVRHRVFQDNAFALYGAWQQLPLLNESPSLTIQWLPGAAELKGGSKNELLGRMQRVMLGTQSSYNEGGQDALIIASLTMPASNARQARADGELEDDERYPCLEGASLGFRSMFRFPHRGDVDRARAIPQQGGDSLVAVLSQGSAHISIYDIRGATLASHEASGTSDGEEDAQLPKSHTLGVQGVHGYGQQLGRQRFRRRRQQAQTDFMQYSDKDCEVEGNTSVDDGFAEGDDEDQATIMPGPVHMSRCAAPAQGLGLAWSPVHEGWLLSSCEGGAIALHKLDAGGLCSGSNNRQGSDVCMDAPTICSEATSEQIVGLNSQVSMTDRGHASAVNDLAWAGSAAADVFLSVGEDGGLVVWDLRHCSSTTDASSSINSRSRSCAAGAVQRAYPAGRNTAIDSLALSPHRPSLVALACHDGLLRVADLRMLQPAGISTMAAGTSIASTSKPINGTIKSGSSQGVHSSVTACHNTWQLRGHRVAVQQVAWDPHHAHMLASSDVDSRILLWDLNRQQPGPSGLSHVPELLMVHAGHCTGLSEFAYNAQVPGVIASVSSRFIFEFDRGAEGEFEEVQPHVLQVWRPSPDLVKRQSAGY